MKLLIIALLLSSCTSCQKVTDWVVDKSNITKDPRTIEGVHPDLQEYVTRFTEDTGAAVIDIPVAIQDLNPGEHLQPVECKSIPGPWDAYTKWYCYQSLDYAAGTCFMRLGLTRWYKWIIVDQEWWDRFGHNDTMVEQMMYHELGHCVLDRDHNDSMTEDAYGNKWPNSIMRSRLFSENQLIYYELQKEIKYIPELIRNP